MAVVTAKKQKQRRSVQRKSSVVEVKNKKKSEGIKKDKTLNQKVGQKIKEVFALILLMVSLYIVGCIGLYVISHEFGAFVNTNFLGPFGKQIGATLFRFFGLASLLIAYLFLSYSIYYWNRAQDRQMPLRTIGVSTSSIFFFLLLLTFGSGMVRSLFGYQWGGFVGEGIIEPVIRATGRLGGFLFAATVCLACLPFAFGFTLSELYYHTFLTTQKVIYYGITVPVLTLFRGSRFLSRKSFQFCLTSAQNVVKSSTWMFQQGISLDDRPSLHLRKRMFRFLKRKGKDALETKAPPEKSIQTRPQRRKNDVGTLYDDTLKDTPLKERLEKQNSKEAKKTPDEAATSRNDIPLKQKDIVYAKKTLEEIRKLREERNNKLNNTEYVFPPEDLLTKGEEENNSSHGVKEINDVKNLIIEKLESFNIKGSIVDHHPGPVITLFEFKPDRGVKVARISSFQEDLAMSLKAMAVRIVAPIPNKDTVGIEVPNKKRDIVRLRDILESVEYVKAESCLSVALGKDTYGLPIVADIASMPHLLIAGATGTGKSVCINSILVSLLYKAAPSELNLILIDPKILELSIYENIPHLKVPVVTHAKQAKAVLDWAVKEMEKRYRLMQKFGVRNIDSYNQIVSGELDPADLEERQEAVVEDDVAPREAMFEKGNVSDATTLDTKNEEDIPSENDEKLSMVEKLKALPKIVIVIDELADLMMQVGRDIEELITRLAQKARAAGIHLIVATQRPSVDVITGLIKANFPARLSFRVSSRIDSRTILDSMGAERLLGKGDMLFMQPGANPLKRMHGAFISDAEVKRVVNWLKLKGTPNYDQHIMDICDKAMREDSGDGSGADSSGIDSNEDYDQFYDKAVELVVEKGQASTSMIQRTFRIGYNRAARIIEMMERDGVVGPMDGVRPREVLVRNSDEI
jgi:DNA segregation ATPase FtsK/SpoIIIE, S-DNA-T family